MKGSFLWKLAYVICALAGVLAGYGILSLTGVQTDKQNSNTKDSTLIRESGDSVLFDEKNQESIPSVTPTVTVTVSPTAVPSPVLTKAPEKSLTKQPEVTMAPEKAVSGENDVVAAGEDVLPSLGSHWAGNGLITPPLSEAVEEIKETPDKVSVEEEASQNEVQEVLTYPAKIFGQTPVINRSDAYVSYFEFCYDLVSMMESEVRAKGLNMNTLMTKFALKALFCGVDIEKLDINAPIPRRLAALCLWLAAQVLNEDGCDTSSKSAGNYVTDISSCSSSEKRAIAYLYESGVVTGYQVAGQKFYPENGLKSGTGSSWLSKIKTCWK